MINEVEIPVAQDFRNGFDRVYWNNTGHQTLMRYRSSSPPLYLPSSPHEPAWRSLAHPGPLRGPACHVRITCWKPLVPFRRLLVKGITVDRE